MILRVFAVELILFFVALFPLVSEAAPPELPARFREYVTLDQRHNVAGFADKIIPEAERRPVPIYHFDVPAERADDYRSRFLDDETKKWIDVTKGDGHYVRFYTVEPDSPAFRKMSQLYGPAQQDYWGVRLQSHSTFLVWDPRNEDAIFLKMQKSGGTTYRHTVETAVSVNDFVETALQNDGPGGSVGYLPERFGAYLDLGMSGDHSYSVRSLTPIRGPPGREGCKLLPLHGFLGSPDLQKAAASRGLGAKQYFEKEYLPKLAKFIAETNFTHGIFTEAHTQNLLCYVNPKTGEIAGFVFRDMNDTSVDPLIRMLDGKKAITEPIRGSSASILNLSHMGLVPAHKKLDWAFGAGWINGGYVGAHNIGSTAEPVEAARRVRRFLELYREEVQRITGVKLPTGIPDADLSLGYSFPGRLTFQAIYDKVVASKLRTVATSQTFNQSTLRKIFAESHAARETAAVSPTFRLSYATQRNWLTRWLSAAISKRIAYTYHDGNVVAYDPVTKRPLAFAYALGTEQKQRAIASLVPTGGDAPRKKCWYSRLFGTFGR